MPYLSQTNLYIMRFANLMLNNQIPHILIFLSVECLRLLKLRLWSKDSRYIKYNMRGWWVAWTIVQPSDGPISKSMSHCLTELLTIYQKNIGQPDVGTIIRCTYHLSVLYWRLSDFKAPIRTGPLLGEDCNYILSSSNKNRSVFWVRLAGNFSEVCT